MAKLDAHMQVPNTVWRKLATGAGGATAVAFSHNGAYLAVRLRISSIEWGHLVGEGTELMFATLPWPFPWLCRQLNAGKEQQLCLVSVAILCEHARGPSMSLSVRWTSRAKCPQYKSF